MKQLTPELQAHLSGGATTLCQCWLLRTRDGRQLGFTDHDREIGFEGVSFAPESGFTGSALETSTGLAADTQDVTGVLKSGVLDETDLAAGVYDGASVEVWLVNWQDPDQRVLLRAGQIGEVTRGPLAFTAEVRGLTDSLNQPQGRLYQYECDALLGDARCGVDLQDTAFSIDASIGSVSEDGRMLSVNGLEEFPQGWFENGTLVLLEGADAGRPYHVRLHLQASTSAVIEVDTALPDGAVQGTQVRLTAGCDKRFETCIAKFSNAASFRGFPHMPGNDFITYYPNPGEGGADE